MNFPHTPVARALWTLGAACALVSLAGCQGEKILARVGPTTITEKAFNERTQRITQNDIPAGTDAGGATMIRLILEEATTQLAKEKNADPTPETVMAFTRYQTRVDPTRRRAIEEGLADVSDFEPTFRYNLQTLGIGTDGAKVTDKEIQDEYDKLSKQDATSTNPVTQQAERNPVKMPEMWTLRFVPFSNKTAATQALAQLKTDGDFRKAAVTAGIPAEQAARFGQDQTIGPAGLKEKQAALYDAISKIPDGQFCTEPLVISNPQNAAQPAQYLDVKVIRKDAPYQFKLEEAKPVLEQIILERTHPDWSRHQSQVTSARILDMMKSGAIQINVKRYQSLLDKVLKPLLESAVAAASEAPQPPAGVAPPSGSSAPPPSSGGSSPPPSSGGSAPSPTPHGSAAPPSGSGSTGNTPPANGKGAAPSGSGSGGNTPPTTKGEPGGKPPTEPTTPKSGADGKP